MAEAKHAAAAPAGPAEGDFQLTVNEYFLRVEAAASRIKQAVGVADIAVVLGSGLNGFVSFLQNAKSMDYGSVSRDMPMTSVVGHDGKVVVGSLPSPKGPVRVMCFSGRVHMYEGWGPYSVNFISRVCYACGVRLFILTNSSGGCLKGMKEGSIMIIRDHVRFTNMDPMLDVAEDARLGKRGLSTSGAYSNRLVELAKAAAAKANVELFEGVYCWTPGPTYETPSEVQAGIAMGCGAFGMSTVPEVVSGHALGMEVFGLSLATNLAAGLKDEVLKHSEVTRVATEAGPRFQRLLVSIISECDMSTCPAQRLAVSPEACTLAPIPVDRPSRFTPSLRSVYTDAEHLARVNAGHPDPVLCFLLADCTPQGLEPLSELITEPRTMLLRDLPGMRAVAYSRSAREGMITLASLRDSGGVRRVVIVWRQAIDGLTKDESSHLVQSLAILGVRTLAVSLLVADAGLALDAESKREEGRTPGSRVRTASLADSFSKTQGHMPDVCDELAALCPRQPGTARFDSALTAAARLESGLSLEAVTYMAFAGPSLPTVSEIRVSQLTARDAPASVVAHVVGVTSIAVVDAALSLGMRTCAVATVAPAISDIIDFVSAGAHNWSNVAKALSSLARKAVLPSAASLLGSLAPAGEPTRLRQLRFVQEDRDKVQQAARFALSALGVASGQLKAAVFLEGPLATALTTSVFKPDGPEIAAATVPFLFDDPVDGADLRGARWRITRSGHTLVVYEAHAQGKWSHFRNVYGLGFCTRMLGAMGVHTALFAPTVAACAPGFAVGELVVVSDHINLTGVNALFGHEKWGIRFPDMKDVYTKALRNAAASASAARKLPESIVAHVGGPVIDSSALGRHANSLGATSMTCGFVQQVIRARHMGMHVFALGFVSQDFAKDGAVWHPHAVPDAAALKRAADILAAVAAAAHKLEPTKQEK